MRKIENPIFPFFVFDGLSACPDVAHFVSSGEWDEATNLNLRCAGADGNRRRLADTVGFDIKRLVTGEQTHSLNVAVVTPDMAGRGALDINSRLPSTDALITNVRGICLMVLTADCAPVLLYDPVHKAVAAVHAGWRGTVEQMAVHSLNRMCEVYGTRPQDVVAAIGPCIGKCCFEVGEEVWTKVPMEFVDPIPDTEKAYVDLAGMNRSQLEKAGVRIQNIEISGLCTRCESTFYSHRRTPSFLGRFGTGIMLLE